MAVCVDQAPGSSITTVSEAPALALAPAPTLAPAPALALAPALAPAMAPTVDCCGYGCAVNTRNSYTLRCGFCSIDLISTSGRRLTLQTRCLPLSLCACTWSSMAAWEGLQTSRGAQRGVRCPGGRPLAPWAQTWLPLRWGPLLRVLV
jgi:hypothetical protein